jgi:hypothetical protein
MLKQDKVDTYKELPEKEQLHLRSINFEHGALESKLKEVKADGEMFAFWSSALAMAPRRASSSSSSSTRSTEPISAS